MFGAFRGRILTGLSAMSGAGVAAGVLVQNHQHQQRNVASSAAATKVTPPEAAEENVNMVNFSGTHELVTSKFYIPETIAEAERIVELANSCSQKIRPVGTFLSPNGIAGCPGGMLSMAQCDRVINIDVAKQEITVEAGIIVGEVITALAPHGLTLENFSSIKEQQMAGWCQVAAHGTGATLSTVDGMITRMSLITPAKGTLQLSLDAGTSDERELFRLARCGLGALGIVGDMTLKCIPAHELYETTTTVKPTDIYHHHAELLQTHRHVRYMWPPYGDDVIVVVSDKVDPDTKKQPPTSPQAYSTTNTNTTTNTKPNTSSSSSPSSSSLSSSSPSSSLSSSSPDPLLPMKELLIKSSPTRIALASLSSLNFAGLRDRLLDIAPLNLNHVKATVQAEVEYWKHVPPRQADSADILGFDCGGEQWVLEMAFPCGTFSHPSLCDVDFMIELKQRFEDKGVCAHFPIEQRWTSASTSYMSPAYSENADTLFSWVGIILYFPPGQTEAGRTAITKEFAKCADIMRDVGEKYGAFPHWAKLELPQPENSEQGDSCELKKTLQLRKQVRDKFDVDRFNKARADLDPNGILSNRLIETLFDN